MAIRPTRQQIDGFLSAPAFAVVGVSANRRKFGNVVFRHMKAAGRRVFPVHPSLTTVEGDACYRSVRELPPEVEAIVTVVPPSATERVVPECVARGIRSIWMQPGSQSAEAAEEARKAGLTVIEGECVMMFMEPVKSVHAFHRILRRVFGRNPA